MHYLLFIHIIAGTVSLLAAALAVVSAKGKKIIQKLIKGENISMEESGLSKREWNELMEAFEIKDKVLS